jgi:hypothetical protein
MPNRRCSEPEPADSLRDKSNVIGGWLRSLTFALGIRPMHVAKLTLLILSHIYPGLNEAAWALAAGFASKVIPLCTELSEIY